VQKIVFYGTEKKPAADECSKVQVSELSAWLWRWRLIQLF